MKQKSVKMNAIMSMILAVSQVIFPLITFPYISRILIPEGIGTVSFVNSFISYFTMFAMLGVPMYGIRVCAQVRDDKEKLSRTVQELLIITAIMSVIAYAALVAFIFTVPKLQDERALTFVCSSAIFMTVISINWFYSAIEEYTYVTVRSVIFNILSMAAMFIFVNEADDYIIYAAITVVASAGSGILNFIHARRYITFKKAGRYNFKQHIKPVLIFFLMVVATTVYTNLDKSMLGFMVYDNNFSVGIYEVSVKIYHILTNVCTALGAVLLPRLSYYIKNGEKEKFLDLLVKAVTFTLIFVPIVAAFFGFFAHDTVLLLSGHKYVLSILPVMILMPAVLFVSLSNLIGLQTLVPMGKEKLVLISVAIGAVVDLVLNLILIPVFAERGNAAVATAISTVCAELCVMVFQLCCVRSELKYVLKKLCYPRIIAINAVLIGAVAGLSFLRLAPIFNLVIAAVVCAAAYVGMLLLVREPLMFDIINTLFRRGKKGEETVPDAEPALPISADAQAPPAQTDDVKTADAAGGADIAEEERDEKDSEF